MDLTDRQTALVLAGLRLLQALPEQAEVWLADCADASPAIPEEIEVLCEAINCAPEGVGFAPA